MTFDMQKWLNDKAITEVECLVSDISGIPRGKILPVKKFVSAQNTGANSLIQQQVTFQGNINAGAAAPAPAPGGGG